MRTRIIAGLIVTLLSTPPVFAQSHPPNRAATITKWALIGAGAGFGVGYPYPSLDLLWLRDENDLPH
jgi:hypothetical protein